jgi:hypothetical protein
MNFSNYPFDVDECPFRLGSIGSTSDTIVYVAEFKYDQESQRHTPFQVKEFLRYISFSKPTVILYSSLATLIY